MVKKVWNKMWIKLKKDWISNLLLFALVIIMIVPSWRLAFSSGMQKIFMGSTELKKSTTIPLNFSQEDWILYDSKKNSSTFSDYKGKPIVLNFWATWCPGCRAELPQIKALKDKFKDDVHFISVSNESYEIINASGEYETHSDFIYYSNYFSQQFEFSAYPTTFIIDSDFNIVQKIEGASKLDSDENIEFLKSL
jgi:thiol-disulfide isomerase/thioredoxin